MLKRAIYRREQRLSCSLSTYNLKRKYGRKKGLWLLCCRWETEAVSFSTTYPFSHRKYQQSWKLNPALKSQHKDHTQLPLHKSHKHFPSLATTSALLRSSESPMTGIINALWYPWTTQCSGNSSHLDQCSDYSWKVTSLNCAVLVLVDPRGWGRWVYNPFIAYLLDNTLQMDNRLHGKHTVTQLHKKPTHKLTEIRDSLTHPRNYHSYLHSALISYFFSPCAKELASHPFPANMPHETKPNTSFLIQASDLCAHMVFSLQWHTVIVQLICHCVYLACLDKDTGQKALALSVGLNSSSRKPSSRWCLTMINRVCCSNRWHFLRLNVQ